MSGSDDKITRKTLREPPRFGFIMRVRTGVRGEQLLPRQTGNIGLLTARI
jgi:hypothetical protein